MDELTTTYSGLVALLALGVAAISLIINLILCISLVRAVKRQRRLTNGNNEANVEQLLIDIRDRYDSIKGEQGQQADLLKSIQAKLKTMKSKIGIHRYNAFAADGNDLSFTIAMVDEEANGVLLTGIHSRDQTYVYAKPVAKGQSSYNLSPEEKETLTQTLR
ncbi:hypothetical protein SD70_19040 [Gordoniibacillus kamchatkensis]|uniref:DUF4446 domain-containing protein n=1 Tax=Gordoniibacillus kamchatkensis TaxID=1590651 RepID=A0ABR5AF91_9BACL|nr:DUF4446 family protein [Paenibacillus sp. VKM B-2647]KIL39620.1 hypothetical protein SD70_19040 [Paenibacillus sp. VKM B-2647]